LSTRPSDECAMLLSSSLSGFPCAGWTRFRSLP
jgi:hypothetical protein